MGLKITYYNAFGYGDLTFDNGLQEDNTLETAILISLFTWRRADTEDQPPSDQHLLGFWGDTHPDVPEDLIGSKLWLVWGKTTVPSTLVLAEELAAQALQWMIDDGIAERVDVTAIRDANDHLAFDIYVKQPDKLAPAWLQVWENTL